MLKKKSLGQHFLRSASALQKIVGAAKLLPEDTVLEVGPGEGVLTELLLQKAGKVITVEKDDRLIPTLQQKFAKEIASGKLELIHSDILVFNPSFYKLKAKSYKLVANLPYYITGQFLRKFLQEAEHAPNMMVLLLQREMGKRMVAQDGKESILSISVKVYGTPKYIATVKAGAFSPPPKVDSAIIAIEDISKNFFNEAAFYSSFPKGGVPSPRGAEDLSPLIKGVPESARVGVVKSLPSEDGNTPFRKGRMNEGKFFVLLKKGFAHPRKLLASNLGIASEQLKTCGIAEKARPENLTLEDWKRLSLSLATS